MKVVFMGTPDFAVPCLEALATNNYDIVAVFTQPDRPKGRGKKVLPPPIKAKAMELSIEVLQPQKIKKEEGVPVLELARNPDILLAAASQQKSLDQPLISVGFAAETENLLRNAQSKLERKGLSLIVANDVSASDAGFAVDTNRVTLLGADDLQESLPLMSKEDVAAEVIKRVILLLGKVKQS